MKKFKTFRDFRNEIKFDNVIRKLLNNHNSTIIRIYIIGKKIVGYSVHPMGSFRPTILENASLEDIKIDNLDVGQTLERVMIQEQLIL